MFMRISWGRVKPGKWQEYEKRYREVLASAAGSQGASARWLLRDLDDPDAGYSVSLWESEEAMVRYSSDPDIRMKMQAAFNDLFTGEFETHLCDVCVGMPASSSS